jgi:hypothetical protein
MANLDPRCFPLVKIEFDLIRESLSPVLKGVERGTGTARRLCGAP